MTNMVKPLKTVTPVLLMAFALLMPTAAVQAQTNEQPASDPLPKVRMVTSEGAIELQLRPDVAPETVDNFLQYAEDGFFDGTIFHRVIPGFMIQGGGFESGMKQKPTRAPIKNEANNGLSNKTGTLAMARTMEPHSASAQFFINVKDNDFLNHSGKNPQGWGYAVFGKVTYGMAVMDNMANVQTGSGGPFQTDAPQKQIIIMKVSEVKTSNEITSTAPLAIE